MVTERVTNCSGLPKTKGIPGMWDFFFSVKFKKSRATLDKLVILETWGKNEMSKLYQDDKPVLALSTFPVFLSGFSLSTPILS
jgi:hypothetical protein